MASFDGAFEEAQLNDLIADQVVMPEEESHERQLLAVAGCFQFGCVALSVVVLLRAVRDSVEGRASCHLSSGWSED